jgi:hypothetical protein
MTSASTKVFQSALVSVRAFMKGKGFRAKGMLFYRRVDDGNWQLLSLQRSQSSTTATTSVAINYGVYSARVGRKLQEDEAAALDIWKAHWRRRVRAEDREKWFEIVASDAAEAVAATLIATLEETLSELGRYERDEALRDEWLSGSSPGLTAMQRLLYLSILVSEIGPAERLPQVVADLRSSVSGGPQERLLDLQLARAGIQV